MHGGVHLDERKRRVEQFRDDPKINILLSSEVGSEGLDFQFCHTLFNYDLPWNPMKVEQRIGRLDRFGQLHRRINIYNLVTENSIEERIFLRLHERIGIFQEAIGDLEAILGNEIRELSNQIFSTRLTAQQESQLAEQASRNIVRRKQEMEEFKKQRLQFMGQDFLFADEVRSAIEAGKFISGNEVEALVVTFIRNNFKVTRLDPDEEDPTCALLPAEDIRSYVRNFVIQHRGTDHTALEFVKRLVNNRVIPLTFNDDIAYQRKLVEFINLHHPLTLAAIAYWNQQPKAGLPVYAISAKSDSISSGDYCFFLMLFQSEGMQQQAQLVPIMISKSNLQVASDYQENFLRSLQAATPTTSFARGSFAEAGFKQAKELVLQFAANQPARSGHTALE